MVKCCLAGGGLALVWWNNFVVETCNDTPTINPEVENERSNSNWQ